MGTKENYTSYYGIVSIILPMHAQLLKVSFTYYRLRNSTGTSNRTTSISSIGPKGILADELEYFKVICNLKAITYT